MGVTGTRLDLWSTQEAQYFLQLLAQHILGDTQQGHHLACPNMPSLIILVITRIQSHGHVPRDWILFCSLVQSNMGTRKICILTYTSCFDEYGMLSCDHACITSHMQNFIGIQHAQVLIFHANNQTCNHHIKCSRCLPWACSGAGHIKLCKKIAPLHFPIFKI